MVLSAPASGGYWVRGWGDGITYMPLPQEDIDGGGEDAGSKRVESDVHGLRGLVCA